MAPSLARIFAPTAALLVSLGAPSVSAQALDGKYTSSSSYGSGWIDLRNPENFTPTSCLNLAIGGTASKVVIRLLRADDDPNAAVGFAGEIHSVPESRTLTITLERDFPNTTQISVHGNPRAWQYALGTKNGPATLKSVSRVPCPTE
jgi:hypothetical protein